MSRRRRSGGVLPLLYLAAAVALAAAVLPSALRPPPDQASASSALSPDAPPDDDPETIIQSLQQAGSRTAGATGEPPSTTTTTAAPAQSAPSRGQCYGDPPRTGESLYAAPCTPAWQPPPEGNGGSTWKNVAPDEVRLGVSHTVGNGAEGVIPEEPSPNESAATRTLRVLQAYFNANYETYGRKIRIVQLPASNASPVDSKAHAVKADEEYRIFGAYYLYSGFCTEMARRTLLTMCNPMPEEYHAQHSPYVWAWMMDYSKVDRMAAEYICKRLNGRNADFAGGVEQGRPRKFGLLYEASEARNAGRTHDYLQRLLRERCGVDAMGFTVDAVDAQSASGRYASAVAQMRAAGVTSIVPQIEVGSAIEAMGAADGSGYAPEWLLFFPYGLDINIIGNLLPPSQMAHAFGMSAWELPARNNQTDCYRAYKSIDPSGTPSDGTCFNFFGPLQQMVNGIQQAGPNLTPETFRDGLYRQGHRFYPQPWAIGGGYGPGDHTYMDNMAEIWWSGDAAKPEDGTPGAYMWVDGGRRYREGEIPETETQVFSNGTSVRTE